MFRDQKNDGQMGKADKQKGLMANNDNRQPGFGSQAYHENDNAMSRSQYPRLDHSSFDIAPRDLLYPT